MDSKADYRVRRTPPPALGPALRNARKRAGLTLRQAAMQCGLSHSHLANLEGGGRCPSVIVARALAIGLNLTPADEQLLMGAAVDDAGRCHPGRRGA